MKVAAVERQLRARSIATGNSQCENNGGGGAMQRHDEWIRYRTRVDAAITTGARGASVQKQTNKGVV
jgi:hypothetical protein